MAAVPESLESDGPQTPEESHPFRGGARGILVNNLGIHESKDFADITDEDWFDHFEVNLPSRFSSPEVWQAEDREVASLVTCLASPLAPTQTVPRGGPKVESCARFSEVICWKKWFKRPLLLTARSGAEEETLRGHSSRQAKHRTLNGSRVRTVQGTG